MLAALYCRVSTEDQAREGYSIPAQRDRLLAFCAAQGWGVADVYIDDGYSGAQLDRPALTRLRQDARAHKFDIVLVWKIDRLSRKVSHLTALVDEFDALGIGLRSATETFDTSNASGRAWLQMQGVFAEMEREYIRQRSKDGIRKRIQEGYIHGRPVMIGYRCVEKGRWVIDPEGAEIVRWIYTQCLNGLGNFRMALMLQSGNVPGLSPTKLREEFSQATPAATADRIRWILRNPVYAGYAPLGDELYPGRHEAIIDPDAWQRVQALMASRSRIPNRAKTSHYLLTGRIFCGLCGGAMFGRRDPNRYSTKTTKPFYEYYTCQNSSASRGRAKTCPAWGVRKDYVEGIVLEQIRKLAFDPSQYLPAVVPEEDDLQRERRSLLSSLAQLERSQHRWFEAFEQDPELEATALGRIRELGEQQRTLSQRLAEVEAQIRARGAPLDRDQIMSYLRDIPLLLDSATPDQLREIIRTLVKRVIVTPTKRAVRGNWVKDVQVEFYPL